MKRLLIIGVLAVAVTSCGSPEQPAQTDIASPVSVEDVGMTSIEEFVTATGTVEATKSVALTSEIAGYYHLETNPATGRPYAIGDRVKTGDVIVRLENAEQVNSIKIESQRLSLELSQNEYEVQQQLYEKGGITLRDLRNAELNYINAQGTLENAQIALERFTITAPFDGIITDILYYPEGLWINSGSSITSIMAYNTLIMNVNLPGKLMETVTGGEKIRVMNYTVPDMVLPGTITQVSPVLDPSTRTFKATMEVDNSQLVLRPGMFVKVEVVVAQQDSVVVIPKDVILSRRGMKSVFIVDRGTALERRITTGLENPDSVEVVDGLTAGDRLVIEGFETLRNRSTVRIVD